MDSIDLDPQPILGMGSDIYWILKRFRMGMGGTLIGLVVNMSEKRLFVIANMIDTYSEDGS